MIALLLFIVVLVYAAAEGAREAYLYHTMDFNKKPKFNEHIMYAFQRGVMGITPICVVTHFDGVAAGIMFFGACALTWSLIHNGIYYICRRRLSAGKVYPDGFTSHSDTSNALISMSFRFRLMTAVLGVLVLISELIIF